MNNQNERIIEEIEDQTVHKLINKKPCNTQYPVVTTIFALMRPCRTWHFGGLQSKSQQSVH